MGRTEALQQFDLSANGFWRSFYALPISMALGVASYLVISLFSAVISFLNTGEFSIWGTTEAIFLLFALGLVVIFPVLHWAAFAYITGRFSNNLGIRETYSSYIIVRNWSAVLLACLGLLVEMLTRLTGAQQLGIVLSYIAMFVGSWVYFRVARQVALASLPISFGLVALEYALSFSLAIMPTLLIGIIAAFVL